MSRLSPKFLVLRRLDANSSHNNQLFLNVEIVDDRQWTVAVQEWSHPPLGSALRTTV
jgi:hypothetical protein